MISRSFIILLIFPLLGYQGIDIENSKKWMTHIARYTLYMLLIKSSHEACGLCLTALQSKKAINVEKIVKDTKEYLIIVLVSIGILLFNKQKILGEDFLLWFIAYLIRKYPEMKKSSPSINYGVGMACSFFEGYLAHVIPSDGANFVGFEENMRIFAASQGIVFPVKRLFIIVTKSLYCPPDLKHFNKKNREDLPYLEACKSLADVEKDVAGVKNRTYRNSAYKIYRMGKPPVYLAAECATPIHTLRRVLDKSALYEELAQANVDEIVNDFCRMLRSIIAKSPECREKCELIYFDDTDPNQNLAEVLLERIRTLEHNFENIKNN